MRRKKREGVEVSEMDLTPMIDVTFLLLIFFLLGTKFKEPEGKLDAYLPKDKGPPTTRKPQDSPVEELIVRVRIDRSKDLYYQIGELTFLDIRRLESHLRQLYPIGIRVEDGKEKPQPVTIEPEAEANYKDVIAVLDACMRIGYTEISFSAPLPDWQVQAGEEHRWH